MENKFKDRIVSLYRRTVRKHPGSKGIMLPFTVFMLSIDRLIMNIRARSRKLVGTMILIVFSFVTCSYSSAIWGQGQADFTDKTVEYMSETEKSSAMLAAEKEIDQEKILEDTTDSNDTRFETLEDISEIDTVIGVDILENIDMDSISEQDVSDESFEGTAAPDFSKNDWQLILVNKTHPIPDDYQFTLSTIKGSMQCDERILSELYSMIEDAYNDGVNLVICSPYRADERQEMLFDRKVNKYMAQGMSYMDSYKLASQAVTIPGSSEHQIGLAIDMISDNYSSLDEAFGDTKAGQWLSKHSYEFGFIIRYPYGKEEITGIEYEPWHLRYVGRNAATVITEENLCLEEFWEKYL